MMTRGRDDARNPYRFGDDVCSLRQAEFDDSSAIGDRFVRVAFIALRMQCSRVDASLSESARFRHFQSLRTLH